jgi:hypothetical protein
VSKVGPYPRTVCGECRKEVAYHLDASGMAILFPHNGQAGQRCVRYQQHPDPRPLIEVLADSP